MPSMMSSSLRNHTSSPLWKASMNSVMSLGGEVNSISVDEVPCSAGVLVTVPEVLGTTSGLLVITPAVFGHTVEVPCLSLRVLDTTVRRLGSATGVLGIRTEVVATTAEPPGSTPGVLGIPPKVLDTPPGVLGIPPEVLGTTPEVLDSTAGVRGTCSAASPPPWMTKCSTTKVLVKLPLPPCSDCASPKLPPR